MTAIQKLIFIQAISALHPGTGQGVGEIDLPVAREKATGIPYLPGSSLKGSLRALYEGDEQEKTKIFGSENVNGSDDTIASAIQFTDQKLIALPVRSFKGTFAYVTSPFLLYRLRRDALEVGLTNIPNTPSDALSEDSALVGNNSVLVATVDKTQKVLLEDLDLQAEKIDITELWANWIAQQLFNSASEQDFFKQRFCVVHDDIMTFLFDTALEVNARIKINENSKTVDTGALWYEEMLPAETILAGVVIANPPRKNSLSEQDVMQKVQNLAQNHSVQLGGKATIGKGICQVKFVGGK